MEDNQKIIENKILDLIDEYSKLKFRKEKFLPGQTEIPVTGKIIDKNEIQSITLSALDGWLTTGRFNKEFESKLSKFINIKSLITVNSGSSANLLSFYSLTSDKLKDRAIKKNDEIITVATSFPTTVNPIIQFGAIPVFVDIKIPNYNINEDLIEAAVTKKTKAIFLAHTLGNPFNIDTIKKICEKYNLWLIEDCCDSLGSTYNNQHVGTFGDIATLSFYPAHHITTGEGGAVFTNNIRLKRIAESFRDWGRDCFCDPGKDNTCGKRFSWQLGELPFGYDHKYSYSHCGFNLKITDMQAACGLAQLKKLDFFISKRKENFNYLKNSLKNFQEYLILPEATKNSDPSWFGFPITIKSKKIIRRDLLIYLNEKKISHRLLFAGDLTKQPYMKNHPFIKKGNLENTNTVMNDTFWLGVYPGINNEHIDYIVEMIKDFIKKIK
jgi:CDP-6-deoxy-D-xylo-4-hexulose-3-dehydrase